MPPAALPVLRTPRLTLRPPEMTDADAITGGIGNYDVAKWLSSVPYPYSRDDAIHWLKDNVGTARQHWLITRDDIVIGAVGNEPHFGFWLARPAWRNGYGFEAAQAAVAHWFANPDAEDLLTAYFPGNDRSAAVLRALGFEVTGVNPHDAKALAQTVDATELRLARAAWHACQTFALHTSRLTLRPLTTADAADMLALANPQVARNTGSFDPAWTLETVTDYIRARTWCGLPGFLLAVEADGQFAGVVGIGGTPVSAMYALVPDHWGRGIATEAMRAFLPEIFDRFPLNRLVADHYEDNPASGAILRKLGFVQTGRGTGTSKARLEPATTITYAVTRDTLRTAP